MFYEKQLISYICFRTRSLATHELFQRRFYLSFLRFLFSLSCLFDDTYNEQSTGYGCFKHLQQQDVQVILRSMAFIWRLLPFSKEGFYRAKHVFIRNIGYCFLKSRPNSLQILSGQQNINNLVKLHISLSVHSFLLCLASRLELVT